jgi:hypothetical protein
LRVIKDVYLNMEVSMRRLHFERIIQAPPEKVWDAIVDESKYREWTSAFHEGSYFEGGWEKGDRIRFLATNEKGEKEGMLSEIEDARKYDFISIKHLGIISGGVEDRTSNEAKRWESAHENYTFKGVNGGTKFEVDVDTDDNYVGIFSKIWPEALKKLEEVSTTD